MKNNLKKTSNPSFVLYSSITAILIFIVCLNPPIDADMWWHLKSGEIMWQQKTILTWDQFSFTKINQPWVNAFWVSDLFMYFLVRIGGLQLLSFIIGLTGSITFLMIFFRSAKPYFIPSFVLIIAAISVSPGWTARPQVFSFFLLAFLNLWLEKWESRSKSSLFLLPFFFIAWTNIHGGFIWGFLLLLATIAGMIFNLSNNSENQKLTSIENIKQLSLWTIVSAASVAINPYGFSIWKLPFHTIDVSISVIQEWFSPNFHNIEMQPFLWMIFLLIIAFSISTKRQNFVDIFKSLGFIYMGFISQRNIPLSSIVISPLIIDSFTESWDNFINRKSNKLTRLFFPVNKKNRFSGIINTILIILLLIVAAGRVYQQTEKSTVESPYPYSAINWIVVNHPAGNMFNSYNWGGFLIYNLPTYPVFIDGRADLYGEEFINEWWEIAEGKSNAITLLDSYNINFIILEPDWPIIDLLLTGGNWNQVYQDEISMVLIRSK